MATHRTSLLQATASRLNAYHLFSPKLCQAVARRIVEQADFDSYQAFFAAAGVPVAPTFFMTDRGRGVALVDIDARETEEGTMVVFLPMGNSLDPNQLYQIATLAWQFPHHRVIAFGNPSGKPYRYKQEAFSVPDWWKVAFTKTRRAAIEPERAYLESQGITNAVVVGYSYGALKALLLAQYANANTIRQLVLLDPVAHPRYPQQLLGDFGATFKPLGDYVNRTELQTFLDARKDAVQLVNYTKGIMRPVNIAIGMMLARADTLELLQAVLQKNQALRAFVAWGSESELGNDAHMTATLHTMSHRDAKGRLETARLEGDKHAFANDVALQAALVRQALLPKQ